MEFDIHSKRMDLDKALRVHIERQLGLALNRFEPFIRRVRVELSPSNGTGRPVSKRCRIQVELTTPGDLELEDLDPDVYTLTHRAAGRVGLSVFSELFRLRESKKRSRPVE
jgi:ribosome-associated translation inhibitor RaiA